jgi:hypothetical protein
MQTIIAGLMALTAMGASILADVDPVTVVARGGLAFVAGIALASVWTMVIGPPAQAKKKKGEDKPAKKEKPAKRKPAEVESEPVESSGDEQEEAAQAA